MQHSVVIISDMRFIFEYRQMNPQYQYEPPSESRESYEEVAAKHKQQRQQLVSIVDLKLALILYFFKKEIFKT